VPDFRVSLDQFSGPLDLLLHLVRTNEMDLASLDLALITDEYLRYLDARGAGNLTDAYAFLAMAATLVEWKSRLLLPGLPSEPGADEASAAEEEDPREALIRQLSAYQSIQETTQELSRLFEQAGRHWPRQALEQMEAEIVYTMDSLSVYDLMTAFQEIISRPRFRQISIFKEDYDIEQGREWLVSRLRASPCNLVAMLGEQPNVFSLIVTFVALLEMIREEAATFERRNGELVISLVAATAPAQL
jgi:segregation and condensation protein A